MALMQDSRLVGVGAPPDCQTSDADVPQDLVKDARSAARDARPTGTIVMDNRAAAAAA